MKIHSITVTNFKGISRCALTLGAGLNVIHGPNDLGKSTLAEAIRAAFVVQTTSKYCESLQPWDGAGAPTVVVEFEANGREWRLSKRFGGSGKATLEERQSGGQFRVEAKGRKVDGTLRQLLAWGLPIPGGGRRRDSAKKPTFVVTALLGEQGDVGSIFEATLKDDPVSSGLELITRSLDVIGRDRLVSRVLEHLASKLGHIMSLDTGNLRRVDSSPLVSSANRVRSAEEVLRKMEEEQHRSADTRRRLRDAIDLRDLRHGEHEDAQRALQQLEQRVQRYADQRKAQQVLDAAQHGSSQADAAHAAVRDKTLELTDAQERNAQCVKEHSLAEAEFASADGAFARIDDAIKASKVEHDKREAVAAAERQRRRAELAQQIQTADTRLKQAKAAVAERQSQAQRIGKLKRLEDELAERARSVQSAELSLKVTKLHRELETIQGLRDKARVAEHQAVEAAVREAAAIETQTRAAKELKSAEARVEALRTSSGGVAEDEQRRVTALQEARSFLVELDVRRRRLHEELEKRRVLAKKVGSAQQLRAVLTECETKLAELSMQLEQNERKTTDIQKEIANSESVLAVVALDECRERLRDYRGRFEAAKPLRKALPELHHKAETATAAVQARLELRPESIERYRILEQKRRSHRRQEPRAVPFPVGIAIGAAAGAGALGSGAAALVRGLDVTGLLIAVVACVAAFVGVGLVVRSSRLAAARQGWQARRRDLDRQWEGEVEPSLRAARVGEVEALLGYQEQTQSLRDQANDARERIRTIEANLLEIDVAPDAIAAAEREAADLQSKLTGVNLDQVRRQVETAPDPHAARSAIREAKERLENLDVERRRLFEAQTQLQGTVQVQAAQLQSRREDIEHASDALDATLNDDVLREQTESFAAARAETEQTIAGLEATRPTDAADRQNAETIEQRDQAKKVAEEHAEAVSVARVVVADAKARLEGARAAVETARSEMDVKAELSAAEEAFQASVSGSANADAAIDEIELGVRNEALNALKQELDGLRAVIDEDERRVGNLLAQLGSEDPAAIVEQTSKTIDSLGLARDALAGEPEMRPADTMVAPEQHREAGERVERAREGLKLAVQAGEAAGRFLERVNAELELLQKTASEHDVAAAAAAVAQAESQLDALAEAEAVPDEALDTARRHLKTKTIELREVEGELRELQGSLQLVGGAVLEERLREQAQLVERQQSRHEALELEYDGYKRLYDSLSQLDANRASHLGQALARPVTDKFVALAGDRYGRLVLDTSLKAEGITAGGAVQRVDSLSVGTRDQLASLVRLAVAEQLQTAILLDDQLVHSDEDRLRWFRRELRRVAGNVQVIVLTCRPSDYLEADEIAPTEDNRGCDKPDVVAIDLREAIRQQFANGPDA